MQCGVMLVLLMCVHISSATPGTDREIRAQRNPGCRKILKILLLSFFPLVVPAGISVFIQDRAPPGLSRCVYILKNIYIRMAFNVLLLMHRSVKDSVNVVFRHFVICLCLILTGNEKSFSERRMWFSSKSG